MFGLGRKPAPRPAAALYDRIVEAARDPDWYRAGGVPDTLDGRFDMLALMLSLVLARAQAEGWHQEEADLVDRFTADIEANLREVGVGDLSISRQVGHGVGALGGRLASYRAAIADPGDEALAAALSRNLYRGAPDVAALGWAVARVREAYRRIVAIPAATLRAGEAPL